MKHQLHRDSNRGIHQINKKRCQSHTFHSNKRYLKENSRGYWSFQSHIFELGYSWMSSMGICPPELQLYVALYCAFIVTNLKGLVVHV